MIASMKNKALGLEMGHMKKEDADKIRRRKLPS